MPTRMPLPSSAPSVKPFFSISEPSAILVLLLVVLRGGAQSQPSVGPSARGRQPVSVLSLKARY